MPSLARNQIVDPTDVGVYHCWARCVRRAYLCGADPLTGKDYEYRRDWITEFEEQLAACFAIDCCFHAEMANHIHLMLRTRPDLVATWSDDEVARRWLTVTHLIKSKDGLPCEITPGQIACAILDPTYVQFMRLQLSHPSALMGALCEHISRRCNLEDGAKGHFWEGRYGCRKLIDMAAVLVCAMYIDLNPIRAGETMTPETSPHTSACDRIQGRAFRVAFDADNAAQHVDGARTSAPDGWLCELTLTDGVGPPEDESEAGPTRRASNKGILSMSLDKYLELLDGTGRTVVSGKPGAIPADLAPILERLSIQTHSWFDLVQNFDRLFGFIVGSSARLASKAAELGKRWLRGQRLCGEVFQN